MLHCDKLKMVTSALDTRDSHCLASEDGFFSVTKQFTFTVKQDNVNDEFLYFRYYSVPGSQTPQAETKTAACQGWGGASGRGGEGGGGGVSRYRPKTENSPESSGGPNGGWPRGQRPETREAEARQEEAEWRSEAGEALEAAETEGQETSSGDTDRLMSATQFMYIVSSLGVWVRWLLLRWLLWWLLLLRWLPLRDWDWERDWVRNGVRNWIKVLNRIGIKAPLRVWIWVRLGSRCSHIWYIRSQRHYPKTLGRVPPGNPSCLEHLVHKNLNILGEKKQEASRAWARVRVPPSRWCQLLPSWRGAVRQVGRGRLSVSIMDCSFQISRVQHQGRAQAAPVSGRLRVWHQPGEMWLSCQSQLHRQTFTPWVDITGSDGESWPTLAPENQFRKHSIIW